MISVKAQWALGPRLNSLPEPDSGNALQDAGTNFNYILSEEQSGWPDAAGDHVENVDAGVDELPADNARSASGSRKQAPDDLKTEGLVAVLLTGSRVASESPPICESAPASLDRMSATQGSADGTDAGRRTSLTSPGGEVSHVIELRLSAREDIPVPRRQDPLFLKSALEPDQSPAAGWKPDLAPSSREGRTSDPEVDCAVTEAQISDGHQPVWPVVPDAPEPTADAVPQICVSEAYSDCTTGEMTRRSENIEAPAATQVPGSLLPAVSGLSVIDRKPGARPAIAGDADRNPQQVPKPVHQESDLNARDLASAAVTRMPPAFLLMADHEQPLLAQSRSAGESIWASLDDGADRTADRTMSLESTPQPQPLDFGGGHRKEAPADKAGRLPAEVLLHGLEPPEKAGKERAAADKPRAVFEAKQAASAGANCALPGLSPAQQITAGLLAEIRQERSREDVAATVRDMGLTPPERMAQKTLRIRLQPESLGDVEVILRKTAASVKIRIAVDSEETAQVLQRDTGLLHDRLRSLLPDGSLSNLEITVRQPSDQGPGHLMSNAGPGGYEPGSNRRPSLDRDEPASLSGNARNDEEISQAHRPDAGLVV